MDVSYLVVEIKKAGYCSEYESTELKKKIFCQSTDKIHFDIQYFI